MVLGAKYSEMGKTQSPALGENRHLNNRTQGEKVLDGKRHWVLWEPTVRGPSQTERIREGFLEEAVPKEGL